MQVDADADGYRQKWIVSANGNAYYVVHVVQAGKLEETATPSPLVDFR
jgi:hypothetical protein